MNPTGKVYLVGAGPGEADLISLRGKTLIETCDVLVMDQLVSSQFPQWVKSECEVLLMGKDRSTPSTERQEEIESTLIDRAQSGKQVVRLKGGDPFVFGRGGEEIEALADAGIPFEIIPGITAALAAASSCAIPLTHREKSSSLVFLTGHEDPEKTETRVKIQEFARHGGTLCVYMGMNKLDSLVTQLLDAGMAPETPAAVVQWAFTPRQRSVNATLQALSSEVKAAKLNSPAVIFVGDVVRRELAWNWYENRPLFGKRVLITRSRKQSGRLRKLLEAQGAEVLEVPMIETRPVVDEKTLGEVLTSIASYEWIVFTSPNGAERFFDLFKRAFPDIRAIGGARFAAIGESTAAVIRAQNLEVDLIPEKAVAEHFAEALVGTQSLPHAMVLVVTGNRNRDILVEKLEKDGEAIVDTLQVYETIQPELSETPDLQRLQTVGVDYVVFTSSSTVEHFVSEKRRLLPSPDRVEPVLASLGPITSKALREAGLTPIIEAESASLESLVKAILDWEKNL